LFITALVMMGIRSLLFAAAATPLTVFAIQALGGMMFPAMWLAGVTYTDENSPAGLKSTAQGLFGAVSFGFGAAVGGFIGGVLLESIGGQSMFFVLGVLILVLLALFEGTRRLVTARAITV
jgi:PPP family 3-phenylpropionic acid transporter